MYHRIENLTRSNFILILSTEIPHFQVIKINPQNGKSIAKIEIPQCPQITSVIFGGENLDTLYVLSAAYKLDNRMNNAGFVFEVTGLGVNGSASKSLRLIPKK